MIYNKGTLQQAQRAMRRRQRRLQSQDPVAYAASEQRCRQRLEALLLAQGQLAFLPPHDFTIDRLAMFSLYFSPEAGRVPRVVYYLCNRRRGHGKQKESQGACSC